MGAEQIVGAHLTWQRWDGNKWQRCAVEKCGDIPMHLVCYSPPTGRSEYETYCARHLRGALETYCLAMVKVAGIA